ncbi:MAG TPA: hypothetical protein VEH06_13605 [Candidatus Bathyarchaeia archaeon]|nr:hypothetical protein [Candidatus Bathyarchaeia archaeon]
MVLFISGMAFGIFSVTTSANVQALINTSPSKYAAFTTSTTQSHTYGGQLHKNSAQQIVIGRQLHTQADPCSSTTTTARIDSLWLHVYDSGRLKQMPIGNCVTVTGTVEDDPRHEPDGDTHFILTLDPKFTGYSRDNNCKPAAHGCNLLIVELICHNPIAQSYQKNARVACGTYKSGITDPKYNEHVSVTGRYVYDTDNQSWGEIHPASDVNYVKSANPQLLTKNPFVPNGENTP